MQIMSHKTFLAREILIKAFKAGDLQAYAHLMRQHQDAAYKIAFAFTKDKNKSQEMTIAGFMRLWNERANIPCNASIIAYLCKYMREWHYSKTELLII
jgi:DNA-directed RNA polymerase specialized sigma24 family protein